METLNRFSSRKKADPQGFSILEPYGFLLQKPPLQGFQSSKGLKSLFTLHPHHPG
jgi:hypothetical protein